MPGRQISLVLFDALHTLVTPRFPVHVQYSAVFEPYLGQLEAERVRSEFKAAFTQVQESKPVYAGGAFGWWGEVVKRTALGSGADADDVEKALPEIVSVLMTRFSGREGYKLFDDVIPTLKRIRECKVKVGVVSNADARMLSVLEDLGVTSYLDLILISEVEGVEKPSRLIWARACERAGVPTECAMHVGDELENDYRGAIKAGLDALLVRRAGLEGAEERKEDGEDLTDVKVIESLAQVPSWL